MEQPAAAVDMFSNGGESTGQGGSSGGPGFNLLHEDILYGCATASQSLACGRRDCGDVRDSDQR